MKVMDEKIVMTRVRRMGVTDRLALVTAVWDEIKDSEELLPALSPEETRELERRVNHYHEHPETAVEWSLLKRELQDAHR